MNTEQINLRNKCIKINDCWIWSQYLDAGGYGRTKFRGHNEGAHRASYIAFNGDIPQGLHIDHLCRRRNCINPSHLEAVTPYENMRRGTNPMAVNARKTHCIRDHEFTTENTYVDTAGKRSCKQCQKIWLQTYLVKKQTICQSCPNHITGQGATGLCKPCTNRNRVLELKK